MSHGQNVTVDVMIGSKCYCGRSELGHNVQAAPMLPGSLQICQLPALSLPASSSYTRSAWKSVSGRMCSMRRVMGLINSPFSAKQRLLLYATVDDDRPETGDMCTTRDSERPGQRGRFSALRPTPSLVAVW